MVANKGLKRKSLAPQSVSPKKSSKITSISANNTPAKMPQKLSKPMKGAASLKQKNVKPTPKKMMGKQKKSKQEDDEDEESSEGEQVNMEYDEEDDSVDEEDISLGKDDSDEEEEEESGDGENGDQDSEDSDDKVTEEVKPTNNQNKNKLSANTKPKSVPISAPGKKVSKDSGHVLFIGNLDFKTTEDAVRQHFRKAGIVVGVNLAKFRNDLSRGFGFVEMKDEDGYKKALKLHHSTLQDRKINVEVTKKQTTEKIGNKTKKVKKAK